MKSLWIRTRLTLLLVVIFLLGAAAGHLATRRFDSQNRVISLAAAHLSKGGNPSLGLGSQADNESDQSSPKLVQRATRTALKHYRTALSLTDEQVTELKSLFKNTGIELSQLPKDSPLRLDVLESFHQKLSGKLTPDQQKLSNEIFDRARIRHPSKD